MLYNLGHHGSISLGLVSSPIREVLPNTCLSVLCFMCCDHHGGDPEEGEVSYTYSVNVDDGERSSS